MSNDIYMKYLALDKMPTMWCPGCGNGIILQSILRAVDELGADRDKVVFVAGIGCSSRAVNYLDFDCMHTNHGRAIAFATGLKMANPDLHAIVLTGDGDCASIGGNHLIHACRRNIDMVAIIMNNRIYGMTGGQFSPLSGRGIKATPAPFGNIDRDFDTVQLALGAGATFVARTTTFHVNEITSLIKKAWKHKGFSVVEILSDCPTYFGRKNKFGGPVQMLEWYRDNTALLGSNPNLIARGVFKEIDAPEYCEEYDKLIAKVRKD